MQQNPVRHLALFFLGDPVREPIEALRQRWDPEMAGRLAPHVTLIYANEVSDVSLLKQRITHASQSIGPLRLHLGRTAVFGSPSGGVYLTVDDVDGGIARLRAHILQPPLVDRWKPYTPHVTLLHPRSGARGEQAWEFLRDVCIERDILLHRVSLVENGGSAWVPLAEFPLSTGTKQ